MIEIQYRWTLEEDCSKPDNNFEPNVDLVCCDNDYGMDKFLWDHDIEFEQENDKYYVIENGKRTGEVFWIIKTVKKTNDVFMHIFQPNHNYM